MTGPDIIKMIEEIQAKAAVQGGRLVDLALPEVLYFTLMEHLPSTHPRDKTGRILINDTQIHMGEDD